MGLLLHVVAGVVPDVELQALYVVLDLAGVAVGAADMIIDMGIFSECNSVLNL